jgi:hypothetical protein
MQFLELKQSLSLLNVYGIAFGGEKKQRDKPTESIFRLYVEIPLYSNFLVGENTVLF